ncbi:MAG: hypothetical protein IJT44_03705 [Clostridia bacterium]|nr:hypothetical protein [Clostridia bacterium]
MQSILTPEQEQEVACPLYCMEPDEEPELHLPEDEVALEEPLLDEAGEPEESFGENTSVWE